ncbi:nitrophenyl compound nitroreductase subunit ArsF family protein [Aeoliella mucimassa]|uniref:Thioredoxin domain-containing protein n=1 Tax=Aeoliella mucimassa TaxID=2527972 RepID=A0A518AS07_9BACT|nr:nitrophenyl compound nitroreductase subunit ArsF family protein [Aeoliella mucimassa]QDU57503.1 hypothetical protein Pan181_37200 [Aeoliella mucimassa]
MKLKSIITVVLLLFVASSVVMLVSKELSSSPGESPAAAASLPDNALVVYYFHGNIRCPTCESIESYSHDAITTTFDEELASDAVVWQVVNYELPENAHFATEYELVSPTVVLVRTADGKVADWQNLVRVWELVGDREAFTEYVVAETRNMLAPSSSCHPGI